MSQPMKRLSAASETRVSMRARAPSKTMVSCGSHSSVAPAATVKSMRCDASAPPLRYHLPAPGVVSCARRPHRFDRNRQLVAAGNPGGRVQQNRLTERIAFRVEWFLNA